ncbi:MAG TPA: BON domain-containing protein [Verrucomicrobiae bacterium]|nr:BON domain-containing protein [Verrucomicrobiae bacterium]
MRQLNSSILKRLFFGLFSLILSLGLLGRPASAEARQQPPPRDAAGYQAWLTKEVRHELVMLPFYSVFDNLQFRVEGDKVTLLGQVVRPTLKDDAAATVKRIEGVRTVDNQIEVLPPSPNDDRIRRAEYRKIYSGPKLNMYALRSVPPIHIIVNGGHVTLEGAVASQSDKDLAGILANQVHGVFSVTNNLRIDNS